MAARRAAVLETTRLAVTPRRVARLRATAMQVRIPTARRRTGAAVIRATDLLPPRTAMVLRRLRRAAAAAVLLAAAVRHTPHLRIAIAVRLRAVAVIRRAALLSRTAMATRLIRVAVGVVAVRRDVLRVAVTHLVLRAVAAVRRHRLAAVAGAAVRRAAVADIDNQQLNKTTYYEKVYHGVRSCSDCYGG